MSVNQDLIGLLKEELSFTSMDNLTLAKHYKKRKRFLRKDMKIKLFSLPLAFRNRSLLYQNPSSRIPFKVTMVGFYINYVRSKQRKNRSHTMFTSLKLKLCAIKQNPILNCNKLTSSPCFFFIKSMYTKMICSKYFYNKLFFYSVCIPQ